MIRRMRRLAARMAGHEQQLTPQLVRVEPQEKTIRGNILFSYLIEPVLWTPDHPAFLLHSNFWEARTIVQIFLEHGFAVDAISYLDAEFVPTRSYEAVFDISWNLARLTPALPPSTIKLLHLTGSDPFFQNATEQRRVDAFNLRTGSNYLPRRTVDNPDTARHSMAAADYCSLLGNNVTLRTFPDPIRRKITLIPVSGSALSRVRTPKELVPAKRQFLWFFGNGAVLKGLDLALEVFLRNPQWVLHIVGNPQGEEGFLSAFNERLSSAKNIHFHGFLAPSSTAFANATRDVIAFIAPSASEGTSPAVATCLQYGFYPIISRNTGVDLPDGTGIWLEECSLEEIEQAVSSVDSMSNSKLGSEISAIQAFALQCYSRESFSKAMSAYLAPLLPG